MLPSTQQTPAAWYGPDWIGRERQWITELTISEIEELKHAANAWLEQNEEPRAVEHIRISEFPLSSLGPKLVRMREELMHGRGFAVIRGLPVVRFTEQLAAIIFCGIGGHLGSARPQNAQGQLLGHVRDLGLSSTDPAVRVYQTKERQTFHTDSCDVVGLLCLQTAQSGGLSQLVSSTTIYNAMLRSTPELLELLMQPIATDRRGEVPPGMQPFYSIPVFNFYEGYLTAIYQRQYIESAQRFANAPRLTPKHIEALDKFDALANDPKLHLSMHLERGDMQFVYNHTLLHDRTSFIDRPEPERRRHLLRLWLSIPGDRPLPDIFAEKFGSVAIGNRGGIVL
jgi:hypothetical protein